MNNWIFFKDGALIGLLATTSLGLAQDFDDDSHHHTNGPPAVAIVTPQDGQAILAGHPIHICAAALNFTDLVTQVEFFAGSNLLGVVTNHPGVGHPEHLFEQFACFTWSNAAPGAYVLTAQATDRAGISVTSAPVDITITTNLPPLVRIVKPHDGAVLLGPTNINVCASAFDPDGSVASVTFYAGGTLIGVVTSAPPVYVTNHHGVFPIRQTSYCLTWSNVPPGSYTLTAVAADNGGATTTSEPVDISVVTNLPPRVRIVSPEDGTRLAAPATVNICAAANDPGGSVSSVQFFSGSTSLGVVTNSVTVTNDEGEVHALYCLTWSNVPPASYTLTAVATDNGGATGTSAPVHLTVVVPPPPTVKIIHPENGARFVAPATIPIAAVARNFTNPIANVRFLAGTNTIGVVTNKWWPTFVWSHVPVGAYSLSAIATDNAGNSATSAPVNITVVTNHAEHH